MQCIFFYKYAINLQISNRKKARKKKKHPNMWKLKRTLFKQSIGQIRNHRQTVKHLEIHKNEDTAYQILWDTVKTMLREQFKAGRC